MDIIEVFKKHSNLTLVFGDRCLTWNRKTEEWEVNYITEKKCLCTSKHSDVALDYLLGKR